MAPWGSVSIEASTLDRSEEGEALVKDGQANGLFTQGASMRGGKVENFAELAAVR